jgi:hypothetical protein
MKATSEATLERQKVRERQHRDRFGAVASTAQQRSDFSACSGHRCIEESVTILRKLFVKCSALDRVAIQIERDNIETPTLCDASESECRCAGGNDGGRQVAGDVGNVVGIEDDPGVGRGDEELHQRSDVSAEFGELLALDWAQICSSPMILFRIVATSTS